MNRIAAVTALVALLACSDSTGLEDRVPALGSYAYSMSIPAAFGTPTARHYTGSLVITFASEDSIAGSWAVQGYQAALDLGFWNSDAYVVTADVPDGFITHRLKKSATGFECEGWLVFFPGGQMSRVDGVCQISR